MVNTAIFLGAGASKAEGDPLQGQHEGRTRPFRNATPSKDGCSQAGTVSSVPLVLSSQFLFVAQQACR